MEKKLETFICVLGFCLSHIMGAVFSMTMVPEQWSVQHRGPLLFGLGTPPSPWYDPWSSSNPLFGGTAIHCIYQAN